MAVITTATDINKKFSVDTFAVRNNLHIGDTKLIKEISSRILNDKKSRIVYRLRIKKTFPIVLKKAMKSEFA